MNLKMRNMTEELEICLDRIQERIERLPEGNHTISIDGRSAAGKTTLSEVLAKRLGARVVHMDDFFLPTELRTKERLETPGGNVHYERFKKEIIPLLNKGTAFEYTRFDCTTMDLKEKRMLPEARLTIVEGAYSCHPLLGEYMSLRIFMDVDEQRQISRIRERNGLEKAEVFRRKWIPLEEAYFAAYNIQTWSDIIIET